LGLLVEALTSGLAGFGRAEEPTTWGTSVFLQVINPDLFVGLSSLEREMGFVTRACRNSAPRPGRNEVRIPGDRALVMKEEQLEKGVAIDENLNQNLKEECRNAGVPFLVPLDEKEAD
jgi:L-lactate dehydrogenase